MEVSWPNQACCLPDLAPQRRVFVFLHRKGHPVFILFRGGPGVGSSETPQRRWAVETNIKPFSDLPAHWTISPSTSALTIKPHVASAEYRVINGVKLRGAGGKHRFNSMDRMKRKVHMCVCLWWKYATCSDNSSHSRPRNHTRLRLTEVAKHTHTHDQMWALCVSIQSFACPWHWNLNFTTLRRWFY